MRLRIESGSFAIVRLKPDAEIPPWVVGSFWSVTRNEEELSIVADEERVPQGITAERGWSLIAVVGPLDFSEVGILASIAAPLAAAEVSLFVISTHDTDFVMVRRNDRERAVAALEASGHEFVD